MQSKVIRLCISISKPSVFNNYLPLDLTAQWILFCNFVALLRQLLSYNVCHKTCKFTCIQSLGHLQFVEKLSEIFHHLVYIKILHVFNHLVSVTKLRVIGHLVSVTKLHVFNHLESVTKLHLFNHLAYVAKPYVFYYLVSVANIFDIIYQLSPLLEYCVTFLLVTYRRVTLQQG